MDRQSLLVITLTVCAVNGIFSPAIALALPLAVVWLPDFLPHEPSWAFYFSSLLVSSATLLVSGVPAALYERLVDRDPDNLVSMYVWLAGAVLLSLPALNTVARL
ncbi:MAG TPA: hypothetical protein VMV26_06945 [Alphaproteobacteria bacterium]|jgi:hypothetical protein|nr:hypothetical protein [Alphaproteobacteria bacterium]